MTGGSLGIRSASYGSLDKQSQTSGNSVLPIQLTIRNKPHKMIKLKERLFHSICKFAGGRKVGMLLLFVVSAAVFAWVVYVAKGEDSRVADESHISLNNRSLSVSYFVPSPTNTGISSSQDNTTANEMLESMVLPPPPPAYFTGYTLPKDHMCNKLIYPPPPVDKKRTGPRPCIVCYLPVEEAIALMPKVPSFSPVLKNLTYIYEENLIRQTASGGSNFGGYPTLNQRSDSYDIRESMNMHCGFVKGIKSVHQTGFEMDDSDLFEMEQCHGVVVASAIFGAFDDIHQPSNMSEYSKRDVCFFMFVDEKTDAYLKNSSEPYINRKVGLWRVVVVRNLPYKDNRRNGKIPKLLVHRLFPNSRFSLWIDGKLELFVDPYQILERFLWRENATFAISEHYKRFDVFTEAEANKAAGKYENASIDFQIEFYKKEGLTPYTKAKYPITSDVPEGCVIIREHVPISNLFTCLWFNEVDRFTSRDQISFSTVRDKITAKTNWTVNMFKDCQRRNFTSLIHHREELKRILALRSALLHPPPPPPPLPPTSPPPPSHRRFAGSPPIRTVTRRSKDKRSGSKRHRKIVSGSAGNE